MRILLRSFVWAAVFLAMFGLAAPGLPPFAVEPAYAADLVAQGEGPALEAPAEEVDDDPPPWTIRYLIPTGIALSAVVTVLVGLGYGIRLRGRYRLVK